MIKRLIAGALLLCALASAPGAVAQVKVTVPSGTSAPAQSVTFGAQNADATFVDATHVLPAGRPDLAATGTVNAATSNAAFIVGINGQGTAGFYIGGLTASGATLTLEGSNDGGAHYASILGVQGGTGVLTSTFTADGAFNASAVGRTNIRLRVSTTGTGTVTVASNLSAATADVALRSPLPPGSNTIGGVTLTRTSTFVTGQAKIAVTGTRIALPSAAVSTVIVTALCTNGAPIVVGGSAVTNTIDGTGNGYVVEACSSAPINVSQLSAININGTAPDGASYVASQ